MTRVAGLLIGWCGFEQSCTEKATGFRGNPK
jgi:hypothetical protein